MGRKRNKLQWGHEQLRRSPLGLMPQFSVSRPQKPNEQTLSDNIVAVIDKWMHEELSDIVKKQMCITKNNHNIWWLTVNSNSHDRSRKHREGKIIADADRLICYKNTRGYYPYENTAIIEYCNPDMFELLERFVMSVYNGLGQ